MSSLSSGMIDQDGFATNIDPVVVLSNQRFHRYRFSRHGITNEKVPPRVQKRVSIEGFREMSILMDIPNSFGKKVKTGSWRAAARYNEDFGTIHGQKGR